jgi:hypothetical protein
MSYIKVQGYTHLVRDKSSNAIVNTDKTEYQLYMARRNARAKTTDEFRNAVKEINNLKTELFEIKQMLKEVIKK